MEYKLLASGAHRAIQVTDKIYVSTNDFVELEGEDLDKAKEAAQSFGYELVSRDEVDQINKEVSGTESADYSAEASGGTTATPNPSEAYSSAENEEE